MNASEQARAAVRAVKNRRKWGIYATTRYVVKRDAFVHFCAAFSFELRRGRA